VDSEFAHDVSDAVRDLASGDDIETTVEGAVRVCVEIVEHCDMAGVSVIEKSGIRTLSASSETLREVDEIQYRLREGPCFDALRHDETVTANDLSSDPRWPRWGARLAERTGLHSSMSFRLFTASGAFGVLNMYSKRPYGFDAGDVLDGHVVAAMVAVAVAASLKEEQLLHGLHTRTVIGQATGILMERFGLDAEAAFAVMRRLSQTHNVKISALAADLVEHGRLPASDGWLEQTRNGASPSPTS
jgi:GAF domain-containing protein